jgi:hypothetical protein
VLVQFPCFVVGGFQDRDASHRGFRSRDDGEIRTSDAEKYFPDSLFS